MANYGVQERRERWLRKPAIVVLLSFLVQCLPLPVWALPGNPSPPARTETPNRVSHPAPHPQPPLDQMVEQILGKATHGLGLPSAVAQNVAEDLNPSPLARVQSDEAVNQTQSSVWDSTSQRQADKDKLYTSVQAEQQQQPKRYTVTRQLPTEQPVAITPPEGASNSTTIATGKSSHGNASSTPTDSSTPKATADSNTTGSNSTGDAGSGGGPGAAGAGTQDSTHPDGKTPDHKPADKDFDHKDKDDGGSGQGRDGLAAIIPPSQVGTPQTTWSRMAHLGAGLQPLSSTAPQSFENDYGIVRAQSFANLTNPGTKKVTWYFQSPNAANNRLKGNSAAAIEFSYQSSGARSTATGANYLVTARAFDFKSPFGRSLGTIASGSGQLSNLTLAAGANCHDVGNWSLVQTVDNGASTQTTFTVAAIPTPQAEWSRWIQDHYQAIIAPFALWSADDFLTHAVTYYFPVPPDQNDSTTWPEKYRHSEVVWNWKDKTSTTFDTNKFHQYLSVKLSYRTNGSHYWLKSTVYDSLYPRGRTLKEQDGSGTLPSYTLTWGEGLAGISDTYSLQERINGVETENLSITQQFLGASVVGPRVIFKDNGVIRYNATILSSPENAPANLTWQLNIVDQTSGNVLRTYMNTIQGNASPIISIPIIWDGKDSFGNPIPLTRGAKIVPQFGVSLPADPNAILQAFPRTVKIMAASRRNVPERSLRQAPSSRSACQCGNGIKNFSHSSTRHLSFRKTPLPTRAPARSSTVSLAPAPTSSIAAFFQKLLSFVSSPVSAQTGGAAYNGTIYDYTGINGTIPAGTVGLGYPGDTWILASSDPTVGISHTGLWQLYDFYLNEPVATSFYQDSGNTSISNPNVITEPPITFTMPAGETLDGVQFNTISPDCLDDLTNFTLFDVSIGDAVAFAFGNPVGTCYGSEVYSFEVGDSSGTGGTTGGGTTGGGTTGGGSGGTGGGGTGTVLPPTATIAPTYGVSTFVDLAGYRSNPLNQISIMPASSGSAMSVKAATGEHQITDVDVALKTAGLPVTIARYFHHGQLPDSVPIGTRGTNEILDGSGWTWSFQDRLSLDRTNGYITHLMPNGDEDTYQMGTDGLWHPTRVGDTSTLTDLGELIKIAYKNHTIQTFQENAPPPPTATLPYGVVVQGGPPTRAFLVLDTDRNGNSNSYKWDPQGLLLQSITDTAGRVMLNCNWISSPDPFGNLYPRLQSIVDLDQRTVTYGYTEVGAAPNSDPYFNFLGFLNAVYQPGGKIITYQWSSQTVTDPNAYDPLGFSVSYSGPQTLSPVPVGITTSTQYLQYLNLLGIQHEHGYSAALTGVSLNGVLQYNYTDDGNGILNGAEQPGLAQQMMLNNVTSAGVPYYQQVITSQAAPPGNTTTNSTPPPPATQSWDRYSDSTGRVSGISDPLGNQAQFEYDDANNLINATDPLQQSGTAVFDKNNNPLNITNSRGFTTSYTWDKDNDLTLVKNGIGQSTIISYDDHFNVQSTTDALNHTRIFTRGYGPGQYGTVQSVKDPLNNVWSYQHDRNGFLTGTTSPIPTSGATSPNQASQTTFLVDGLGRRTATIDALNRTVSCIYDDRDRVVNVTEPIIMTGGVNESTAPVSNCTYNESDQVVNSKNALGQVTTRQYDSFHRLTNVTEVAPNLTTSMFYDSFNNLVNVTKPNGAKVSFKFNKANQMIEVDHPTPLGPEKYDYDAAGHVKTWTKSDGSLIAYTYTNNLLTNISTPPSGSIIPTPAIPHVSYGYDGLNRIQTMTDLSGSTYYSYTQNSHLSQVQRGNGISLLYHYDGGDRLTSTVDSFVPTGGNPIATAYTYNELNEMTSATLEDASNRTIAATVYDYNLVGSLANTTYSNGIHCQQSFDEHNNLATKTYFKSGVGQTAPIVSLNYGRDILDRISNTTQAGSAGNVTKAYLYNDHNELMQSIVSAGQASPIKTVYNFDQNYNRVTVSYNQGLGGLGLVGFGLNGDADQTNPAGASTLHYNFDGATDMSGSTASYNPYAALGSAVPTQYSYDWRDQLTGAVILNQSGPSSTCSYQYDGNNQRLSKTVNGTTTNYVWNGGEVSKEYYGPGQVSANSNGQVEASYLLGMGREAIVQWDNTVYTYITDAQGSVIGLADGSGNLAQSYSYDDYGTPTSSVGSNPHNPYRFQGQQYDDETGLYYLRNRYMNPALGKFIQKDPAGYGAGMNLYDYCNNDPINHSDPSGEDVTVYVHNTEGVATHIFMTVTNPNPVGPNPAYADKNVPGYIGGALGVGVVNYPTIDPAYLTNSVPLHTYTTTPAIDQAVNTEIQSRQASDHSYSLTTNSCVNFPAEVLNSTGVDTNLKWWLKATDSNRPGQLEDYYNQFMNPGKPLEPDIVPIPDAPVTA